MTNDELKKELQQLYSTELEVIDATKNASPEEIELLMAKYRRTQARRLEVANQLQ